MRTEEVAKNIFRIPVILPNNPLKAVNSYLIKDPKQSLLIDTGFRLDSCREDLLAGLAELNQDPSEMDIFLTHLHADHSGLAATIIGKDHRIIMGETDREWLVDLEITQNKWQSNAKKYAAAGMTEEAIGSTPTLSPIQGMAPIFTNTYVGLEDGAVISVGGYDLRCIMTPGHTPGHICLWDEKSRMMFTGDHVLFDITPNITVWGNLNDSLGHYLESLKFIRDFPVEKALPGHRTPGDFHKRIDELLAHHDARLASVLDIIRHEPGLTGYEIAGRMKWRIRATSWDDFPPTQKIFAVGECLSHLEYLQIRDKLQIEKDGEINHYYMNHNT